MAAIARFGTRVVPEMSQIIERCRPQFPGEVMSLFYQPLRQFLQLQEIFVQRR